MNTTLSTTPGRHDHPPQPTSEHRHTQQHERLVRRVSLLDRAALHLGVALITWSRRPLEAEDRERRARRAEQRLARLARERAAEDWTHLNVPRH